MKAVLDKQQFGPWAWKNHTPEQIIALLRQIEAKIANGKSNSQACKETDRSWDQGGDPSILDFKLKEYGDVSKMVIADPADRKRWKNAGVRDGMRKSGLSQKAVYAILDGEPVRLSTIATFRRAVDG